MVSTTLDSGRSAKQLGNGALCVQTHLLTFTVAAFTDNDTIQIAKLPARSRVMDVKLAITDLDSSTDMEIDVGLNPAPGGTTADANILADGLTTTVQSAGVISAFAVAPTVVTSAITAGIGIETHADLDSVVYLTMIDNGDATTGTIYSQVWYTVDDSFDAVAAVNS